MNQKEAQAIIQSAENIIAEVKAHMELEGPKWTPKVGELCEVWDEDDMPEYPRVSRFHHFDKQGDFRDMEEDGSSGLYFDSYRKLHTPATRHEWAGSTECPVDPETRVAIRYRDCGADDVRTAKCTQWDHSKETPHSDIVAYWILEP